MLDRAMDCVRCLVGIGDHLIDQVQGSTRPSAKASVPSLEQHIAREQYLDRQQVLEQIE